MTFVAALVGPAATVVTVRTDGVVAVEGATGASKASTRPLVSARRRTVIGLSSRSVPWCVSCPD
jgi:hypothetical protein